jgi:hypothetical protein
VFSLAKTPKVTAMMNNPINQEIKQLVMNSCIDLIFKGMAPPLCIWESHYFAHTIG